MKIQQFRKSVYQSIEKRADAMMDLIDAMSVAKHVESTVALSEDSGLSYPNPPVDMMLVGSIRVTELI